MRNLFDQHMGSMFGGGGGFPRGHGPGFPPDFMHDHGFHQQHHDAFFRSAFGDRDPFRRNEQQQQQQRPTLFSTSPFANSTQTQSQSQWSGTGSRSSPFTMFGSNGDGRGGFTTSSSSSSSSMGGGGSRTSTKTTVVNGKRTTVTEVTDAQGVTTTTVDNPDGTRETFVNGVATAIEGRAEPTVRLEQGSAGQQPIIILDDDDDTQVPINSSRDRGGRSSNPAGGGGSSGGYRLGGRDEGADSSARRASRDRNQYQRSASSAARPEARTETVFLDDDDDDEIMYETLSEHRRPRQQRGSGGRGATAGTGTGAGHYAGMRREQSDDFEDNEPDLFHPQMGNGQSTFLDVFVLFFFVRAGFVQLTDGTFFFRTPATVVDRTWRIKLFGAISIQSKLSIDIKPQGKRKPFMVSLRVLNNAHCYPPSTSYHSAFTI